MSSSRLLAHSLRTLPRYKLRTALLAVGSIVGAGALTLVLALGQAAQKKTLATVRQLFGASSVLVMAGGTELMGGPRPGSARLTLDDLTAVAAAVPDVVEWDPQQAMPNAAVRREGRNTTARVLGESERSERVWDRTVSRGQYFDAAAVTGAARVALIGETAAQALFPDGDALDGEIQIGSVPFRVIGVLQRFGTDLHGMDRDNEIIVPITTLQRRLMNVDTISGGKLLVRDPDLVAAASERVRQILRERHGLPEGRPDDFRLISAAEVQRMVGKMRRVLAIYLPLAALLILVTGGVVAAAVMLSSVRQRVHEIGLRRAVGARPEDIGRQFLIETAATALGGGAVGVIVGSVLIGVVAARMHLEAGLSWSAVAAALAASAIVGLLAGVLPARRAARLQPADALR